MSHHLLSEDQIRFIESFLSIFCKAGNIPRSRLYIWGQMHLLKSIVQNNGWQIPYAAFRNKGYKEFSEAFWREEVFEKQGNRFNELYDIICDMPLNDYLLSFDMQIVKQPEKLEELRQELVKNNSLYKDDLFWEKCILYALGTYQKYHASSCNIVEKYCEFLKQEGVQIEDDAAFDILACTTMYPFNSCLRKENGNAMAACELLDKKCHFTPENMLELYADARKFLKKGEKVKNPIHYIRAAKGSDSFRVDVGYEDAINEACKHIQKVKRPSDFIGVAMERECGENSRIETGFVQNRFRNTLRSEDNILIINPSAYFVQAWPEKWQSKTTFCVMNKFEKVLYEQEFSVPAFALPDEINSIDDFTKVLYFPRPNETDEQNALMTALCKRSFTAGYKEAGLMMLVSEKNQYLKMAETSYQGIYKDFLPRETIGVAPKKRVLATAIGGANRSKEAKQFTLQFCCPEGLVAYKTTIEKSTKSKLYLLHCHKPVAEKNKTERTSRYVEFTPDIRIWYKQRNTDKGEIRVEAAVYRLPTESQQHRNKNKRGTKLEKTSKSKTCCSEEAAKEWLINQYPYTNVNVQELLRIEFKNRKKEVALKTAWYLTLNISNYKKGLTQELNESHLMPYFGNILVGETDQAQFRAKMDEMRNAKGMTQAEEKNAWNTLDKLFSVLVKERYCEQNPITEINAAFRPRHTRESTVRDALTKKSFSAMEMRKLYQFLSEHVKPSETDYLGVALRLLTGLKPEVLCGLKWDDLKKIGKKDNAFQLLIMRKVASNGEECVGLDTCEEYRRYPLMELASEVIIERRNYILENCSISEKELGDKYILSSDADLMSDSCPLPHPNALKRLSKEVVDELEIEDIVLILPDKDGSKETVLTNYHGDIFNINFRYHLNFTCGISNAVERYLMGLQQTDTYSKHYVDFANDQHQVRMMTQMNRLSATLLGPDEITVPRVEKNSRKQSVNLPGKRGYRSQVDLWLEPAETESDSIITVESLHGEHISFQVMVVDKDDR